MSILVIGATGTVGRHVVRRLQGRPERVRIGVHTPEHAAGLAEGNIEAVPFDFYRPDTMERALEGIERVFLLTPPVAEANEMARRAIDVLRGKPLAQVVRLSILNADDEPGVALTRAHREVERLLDDAGLPWTFLRPNYYMETFLAMKELIRAQSILPIALGNAAWSIIAVRDIGDAAAAVLTSDGHVGKAYDLTGPDPLTGTEMASVMSTVLGRPIRYVALSEAAQCQALAGLPQERIDAYAELFVSYRAGEAARVTDTVCRLAGHPGTTFRDWMREHAAAFRPEESQAA